MMRRRDRLTTPALRLTATFSLLLALALQATAQTATPLPATPANDAGGLPRTADVVSVLTQSPAYQASLQTLAAEQAVQTQYRVGTHEWTGVLSAARRNQRGTAAEQTQEWDIGLDRAVRLPGKRAAYEQAGQARVELAQAARLKAWRDQARLLLERHGAWLRERASAAVWAEQQALLKRQFDAVSRRQALGDAAVVEQQLAEAAWVQAEVQAQTAAARAVAARDSLARAFPGLDLSAPYPVPPPQLLANNAKGSDSDAVWLLAQHEHSPELALARSETTLADAQGRIEQTETRPDPTVGVRVGQARSGNERFLGLVFSLPFGGEYRAAGATAAAARAAAATLRLADTERRVAGDGSQRLHDTQQAQAQALGSAAAAQRLVQVADSLQRSYQLGEGSLGDVLAARRLANEQRLTAAVATVEAWLTRQRLALEAGRLWPDAAP
jgi:outer membrane protein TolC